MVLWTNQSQADVLQLFPCVKVKLIHVNRSDRKMSMPPNLRTGVRDTKTEPIAAQLASLPPQYLCPMGQNLQPYKSIYIFFSSSLNRITGEGWRRDFGNITSFFFPFSVYRAKVCISVFTFVCIMQFAMFETVISAVIDEFPKVLRKRRPVFGFFCHLLGFLLGIPMTMKVPFFCGGYVNITTIFTVLSRTMATMLLFFCVWYVNMTMKIPICCVRCTRWYPSFIYGV